MMNDINYDTDCMKRLSENIYIGEISPVNHQYEWEYQQMINKYWDGFWWLDALGFTSKIGQKVAQRWRLYAENETVSYNKNLIGNDYIPNPDYYTSYLFKYIMGIKVLDAVSSSEYLRVYAHCTSPRINGMIYGREGNGNLTLKNPVSLSWIGLFNRTGDDIEIYIERLQDFVDGEVLQFLLTPGNKTAGSNGLESTTIALNDKVLELNSNGLLPDLRGEKIDVNKNGDGVKVPGMSYGFLVFTQTNIDACAL